MVSLPYGKRAAKKKKKKKKKEGYHSNDCVTARLVEILEPIRHGVKLRQAWRARACTNRMRESPEMFPFGC